MPQLHVEEYPDGLVRVRAQITVAEIAALGANTEAHIALGHTVPAKSVVTRVRVENGGTVFATLTTLTAGIGDAGNADEMLDEATIFAANASVDSAPLLPYVAKDATWVPVVNFIGNANLGGITGGAPGGVRVFLEYRKIQS